MNTVEAYLLARFLERMIKWKPSERPSAQQMLNDPWLKLQDDWDPYISRRHLREIKKATNPEYSYSETTPSDAEDEESGEEDSEGEE